MDIKKLNFEPHPGGVGGTQATVIFDNGYGASVITGYLFYTRPNAPYELSVTRDGVLAFDTPIADGALGYQTASEVEKILDDIANLPVVNQSCVRVEK